MLKRVLPCFILLIFLYVSIGHYITFKVRQQIVKAEISLQLEHSLFNPKDIESIQIDRKDTSITWLDEKEFIYNGYRYDLVNRQFAGNYILIYAIKDTKEVSLLSDLKSFIHSMFDDQENGKSNGFSSFKDFQKEFFFEDLNFSLPYFAISISDSNTLYQFSISSPVQEINSPPPQQGFQIV